MPLTVIPRISSSKEITVDTAIVCRESWSVKKAPHPAIPPKKAKRPARRSEPAVKTQTEPRGIGLLQAATQLVSARLHSRADNQSSRIGLHNVSPKCLMFGDHSSRLHPTQRSSGQDLITPPKKTEKRKNTPPEKPSHKPSRVDTKGLNQKPLDAAC